jgi:hypothetical protein
MSVPSMLYVAALSAALALVLLALVAKQRDRAVLAVAGLTAGLGRHPVRTHTTARFSHDLPFPVFPISWQDTGSGVFTLAGAATALALGPTASWPARKTARLALWVALAALLVDIYTY